MTNHDEHVEHVEIHRKFLADVYAGKVDEQLKRDLTMLQGLKEFGDKWNRKSHTVSTPKPSEYHTAYEFFKQNYLAMIHDGKLRGYLDEYASEDALLPFDPMTHEIVWDETEEEWEARKAQLPDTVTFHVHKGDR